MEATADLESAADGAAARVPQGKTTGARRGRSSSSVAWAAMHS